MVQHIPQYLFKLFGMACIIAGFAGSILMGELDQLQFTCSQALWNLLWLKLLITNRLVWTICVLLILVSLDEALHSGVICFSAELIILYDIAPMSGQMDTLANSFPPLVLLQLIIPTLMIALYCKIQQIGHSKSLIYLSNISQRCPANIWFPLLLLLLSQIDGKTGCLCLWV